MNKSFFLSIPRSVAVAFVIALYCVAFSIFLRRYFFLISRRLGRKKCPAATESKTVDVDYKGPERRIFDRKRFEADVRYKKYGIIGIVHVFKEGKLNDISEGGLSFSAPEKLSMNDKIEFKLKLPKVLHFILMRGIVVWEKQSETQGFYDYGISVIGIDPNDRKQIVKYIASEKAG